MPARHISSQSFDEILSDLGDDPAIPDPHGIRKQSSQQSVPPRPPNQGNQRPFSESFAKLELPGSAQKIVGFVVLFTGILIAAAVAIAIAYTNLNQTSQSTQEESEKQIFELKKEIALMRDEFHQDQDDLYAAIDEIEVSIHSLLLKPPLQATKSKLVTIPHEAELRLWRYLGLTQMAGVEQAIFHTGKGAQMINKLSPALGEWRLSQVEKELAILTHPQGKSITFKSTQSE